MTPTLSFLYGTVVIAFVVIAFVDTTRVLRKPILLNSDWSHLDSIEAVELLEDLSQLDDLDIPMEAFEEVQ